MKMKSFAMIVLAGLLTASFAYIAPAMADDTTSNEQAMEPPTDNGMNQNNSSSDMNSPNNNQSSTDSGMPDTATGDDDY